MAVMPRGGGCVHSARGFFRECGGSEKF